MVAVSKARKITKIVFYFFAERDHRLFLEHVWNFSLEDRK